MLNGLKKCLLVGLSATMLLTTITPAAFASGDNFKSNTIELEVNQENSYGGLVLSPEEFNNAFAGEIESRFMPFNIQESSLDIRNINVQGNRVSLDLILSPVSFFGNIVSVTYEAYVTRLNGNQNELTITIYENFEHGFVNEITKTFMIYNNSSGIFNLGHYDIYVSTQGNMRINALELLNDGTSIIALEGNIYQGSREGALILEVTDNHSDYEVVLFQLNIENNTNNLLLPNSVSDDLVNLQHAQIYLQDPEGRLNLFEIHLPEVFKYLDVSDFNGAENYDDLWWFMDFIEPTVKVIPADELTEERLYELNLIDDDHDEISDDGYIGIVPLGLNTFTNVSYTDAFWLEAIVGTERSVVSSRPSMRRTHTNIGRNGTGNFQVEFRVIESTLIYVRQGNSWRHLRTIHGATHNIIDYRNVSAQIVLGEHSRITHMTLDGNMRLASGSALTSIFRGGSIRTLVMTAVGLSSTAQAALNLVRQVASNTRTQNVRLGNVANTPSTETIRRVYYRLNSGNYRLYRNTANSGHNMVLNVTGRRTAVTANQSAARQYGAVAVQFEVFIQGTRRNNFRGEARRRIDASFSYTVDRRP